MKKLVFMFATVAIVAGVQAASVDWSTEKNAFSMKSGANASGISVYLLNADATGYSSVISGLANGTVTSANIASQTGVYLDTGTTGTSSKKYGKVDSRTVSDDTAFTAGQNYNLAYVVFETVTSGTDAGDWYYVSTTKPASAWGGEYLQDLANPANWDSASYSASNWSKVSATEDVPEPTSGLLLVIGGAMLALRRRR